MVFGLAPFVPGVSLDMIGMPTCTLDVNLYSQVVLPAASGAALWSVPVPNLAQAMGVSLYHQALTLDPGANALGVTASEAADALIGR